MASPKQSTGLGAKPEPGWITSTTSNSPDATSLEHEEKEIATTTQEEEAAAKSQNGDPSFHFPVMSPMRRRFIIFSLCLAQFLSALDVTIVSTALPTIAKHLDANASEYAWIGSSYTLANTSSVSIWAKLSDIFGRKPVILAANLLFLAGSLMTALANSIEVLIGGRVLQGLGGGGLAVLVTIVISDLFELKDRAKYYGVSGLVYAIASASGPVLGGVFTQSIGWRWCFYINLPFDGVSLIVLLFALKINTPKIPLLEGLKLLDWVGSALIIGGTICFLYGLETAAGGATSWGSPIVVCLLVFGVVIIALFFFYESRFAANPLIPTRIFAKATNVASISVLCIHSFVFISYDYFLPLYFQMSLGFKPIISGVALFALVIPLCTATMPTGFYVRSTRDYLWPTWGGALAMTLGTGLLISLQSKVEWPKIILYQLITGIGAGPLMQAPMIALQSHLPQAEVSAGMSAMMFARNLSTSMSIVIGTVILQKDLGQSLITTDDSVEYQRHYVSSMRPMWIFFTAMAGFMTFLTVFIKPMPKEKKAEEKKPDEGRNGEGLDRTLDVISTKI